MIISHVVGSVEVCEQQTSWPLILENSQVVVLWGMNPLNTLKITWSNTDERGLGYFHQLKKSGKPVVATSPIRSEIIEFSNDNTTWITPNVGTDVALMLGIVHILMTQDRHDKVLPEKYTTGYPQLEEYLTGKSGNTPRSVVWTAEITDVPEAQIIRLTELIAANRITLMAGWGIQRQQYGEQKHWTLATLAAMSRQIDTPGGDFGFSCRYSNGGNPMCADGVLPGMSTVIAGHANETTDDGGMTAIPVARIVDALENPGGKYQHNGKEQTHPNTKMIWWTGGGNFIHHQDTSHLIKAWQESETIVVSGCYWTATARYADIVLPIAILFKRNDLTMTGDYSNQHIVPMEQAVVPRFEARNGFDVFVNLTELFKPGGKKIYTEGKDGTAWLKSFYDAAQKGACAQCVTMPVFNAFWRQNKLIEMRHSEKNEQYVHYGDSRVDPVKNMLGTPSDKIEIYSKTLKELDYKDCPAHPTWLVPDEWEGTADEKQLQLLTVHPAHRLHSQLNYAELRKKYTIISREPITIHTGDATHFDTANGNLVRVWNKRGQILIGAMVTDGIKKGVVYVHEGA